MPHQALAGSVRLSRAHDNSHRYHRSMSVSYWAARGATGDHTCDFAVIGAGVVGLGAALALQDAGVDALVIDKGIIGAGASGRNAGYLMRGAADNYAAAVRDWGREKAKFLWQLSEANQTALLGLGADDLPGCIPRPSCLLAASDTEAEELRRSAKLMLDDGFDCELVTHGDDIIWANGNWPVALINPRDFVCDSLQVLTLLAGKLKRPPLLNAEVHAIEPAHKNLRIRTSQGTVCCNRALICTNAWTGQLLPKLNALITPHRAQMLALDASSINAAHMPQCGYYADHGSEYLRAYDERTILLGGKRKLNINAEQTIAEHPTMPIQMALEQYAQQTLGRTLPVVHRWTGIMAFTPDGLPLVGPVDLPCAPDLTAPETLLSAGDDRLWVCAGFTGHGMSLGYETARRTVNAMLGTSGDADIGPMKLTRFKSIDAKSPGR